VHYGSYKIDMIIRAYFCVNNLMMNSVWRWRAVWTREWVWESQHWSWNSFVL